MAVGPGLRNQWIAAVAASLSALSAAAAYAWLTPLLPRMLSGEGVPVALSGGQLWWAAAAVELGCLLAPLPSAALSARVGRKLVVLGCAPLSLLGWTVLLRWRTASALAVARLVHGLAAGALFATVPAYLGEIACPRTRRPFSALFPVCWWAGYSLQCWAGSLPRLHWLPYTYLAVALNLPFCLLLLFQPESPAFHLTVGDEERATRSLLHFRDGTLEEVRRELDSLRQAYERGSGRRGVLRELTSTAADRRALYVLLAVVTVRIASGNSALAVFAPDMLARVPGSPSPYSVAVVFGLVMLVGSLAANTVCDTFGRRPLLVASCAGGAVCHAATATYFLLLEDESHDLSATAWLPALTTLAYSAFYSIGMNPVTVAYTSELFRPSARGIVCSLATLYTTALVLLLLALYAPIVHLQGMHLNFYLYALACLSGCVYFYLRAPETRGKSFFQIRKEMSGIGEVVERDSEREPLFSDIDIDQL